MVGVVFFHHKPIQFLAALLINKGGIMAICPVANSVGCEKCAVVNVCFLKTVLGNYGEEKPKIDSEAPPGDVKDESPDL